LITNSFSLEWTVNTADVSDASPAFEVKYEEWTNDGADNCDAPTVYTSTSLASGEEFVVEDATTCAYKLSFSYSPEARSGTQDFSVYFDSASMTAISAFIVTGVASMLF
jgi:hypothetical protein